MLKLIIEMLKYQEIGYSTSVDIAKGKNKLPENLKEFKNAIKWQLKSK